MDDSASVIILNGVGSVGKSSVAKALQQMLPRPFLHVQMDSFMEMLPLPYWDHESTFSFNAELNETGEQFIRIDTGDVGHRLMRGMRAAIVAMAREGNDLILDDVMLGDELREYRKLLSPFNVFAVGLHASLDVLEQRERDRQDRLIGLARGQYNVVHKGKDYDFEVETSATSPEEIATLIVDRFSRRFPSAQAIRR